MSNRFDERIKAVDPRFSVVQKQLKKQNARTLNDKKDVDSFVNQAITKHATELEQNYVWPLILSLFILLQSVISSGSYSGAGQGKKFGDFEAQRHWMELTINLPIHQWYFNTTNNDLNYWGLDYPPLTAYHSCLFGEISKLFNPQWVTLKKSRGHESPEHKLFMRLSVIVTMIMLYAPIILNVYRFWYSDKKKTKKPFSLLFSMLCFPGLLYVDNGHFQYNHIPLALVLLAFKFFCTGRQFVGSVLFVLALSFKQMSLYYALPIFVFLFFRSFTKGFTSGCINVAMLGIVVILTFGIVWLPFLTPAQLPQVLHRVFPIARGLYEDKVAVFWCAVSPIYKFNKFPINYMVKVSSLIVLLLSTPTLLLLARRPNERNFAYSLFLCSMAFFLFSVQVHEKTILFVAIPALLLLGEHTEIITTFLFTSMFSMFPLVVEDNLTQLYPLFVAYYLILLFKLVSNNSSFSKFFHTTNILTTSTLALMHLVVKPPERYPHIFTLAIAEYSFVIFSATFAYIYYKNLSTNWTSFVAAKKKTN